MAEGTRAVSEQIGICLSHWFGTESQLSVQPKCLITFEVDTTFLAACVVTDHIKFKLPLSMVTNNDIGIIKYPTFSERRSWMDTFTLSSLILQYIVIIFIIVMSI